jgi:hypothetical protein
MNENLYQIEILKMIKLNKMILREKVLINQIKTIMIKFYMIKAVIHLDLEFCSKPKKTRIIILIWNID